MERIKSLTRYQKALLLSMLVMVLVFTVIYPFTITREGVAYKDVILTPVQENGNTVYAGKIQGEQARFTVSPDGTVGFQYGDHTYGPYTVREDPTAIPEDNDWGAKMTGVELYCDEELIFRGGMVDLGEDLLLFQEDGSLVNAFISVGTSQGIELWENGNAVDPMEPSAFTILHLMNGPELTHKGAWDGLVAGIFLCALAAVSILFADELFRWTLSFRIMDPERVEPSDWEIITRHISWTVLAIGALVIFIIGLQ